MSCLGCTIIFNAENFHIARSCEIFTWDDPFLCVYKYFSFLIYVHHALQGERVQTIFWKEWCVQLWSIFAGIVMREGSNRISISGLWPKSGWMGRWLFSNITDAGLTSKVISSQVLGPHIQFVLDIVTFIVVLWTNVFSPCAAHCACCTEFYDNALLLWENSKCNPRYFSCKFIYKPRILWWLIYAPFLFYFSSNEGAK